MATSTQTRLPSAVGFNDTWTLGAGASKVIAVRTSDGDTGYISRVDSAGIQLFTLTPFQVDDGATVTNLRVSVEAREAAGDATIEAVIRVNDTNYFAGPVTMTGSYGVATFDWATNPNTTLSWVSTDIEGTGPAPLQGVGCRCLSMTTGDEARVTYIDGIITIDADTVARSGVARSGCTKSGDTSAPVTTFTPTFSLVIAGTDRQQEVSVHDASMRLGLDSEPSELSARIVPRGAFTVAEGQDIRVYQGGHLTGVPLFGGVILRVTEEIRRQTDDLEYLIEASDYRWLLDRFSLVSKFYWNLGVNAIVADLIKTYADPSSGFTRGYVPASLGVVDFIEFDNLTITACLDKLSKSIDGGAHWEVDGEKRVSLYDEPDDEGNTIAVAEGGPWRMLTRERDAGPTVNRVIFIGGGSATTAMTAVGASSIAVEETSWYNPSGGSARAPCNTITYTGRSIGSGPGSLTGVSGVIYDIPSGTTMRTLYQADDAAEQTALAAKLGGGQSGIATYQDGDDRFGYERTQQAAESLLDILKKPTERLQYGQAPDGTVTTLHHIRPGRLASFTVTTPVSISGSYRVRSVALEPHARRSDGSPTFLRTVTAETSRRTVIQALKDALAR